MVNPLARVVMKNIVNKTDHSRPYVEEKKVLILPIEMKNC